MNNKWKYSVFLIGILMLMPIFRFTTAQVSTPGTTYDPMITKSYFDQNRLSEAKVNELIAAAVANLPNRGGNDSDNEYRATSDSINVVNLKPGQILYAGAGTEFIVRTGKTIAVSNDEDGIPDVTAGKDIPAGTAISNNHLLVFPKDTRGIKPDPKNTGDIFVMVRGTYLLMNADGTKAETSTP